MKQLYSHPQSKKYPNGKPLTIHIEHVKEKALKKYAGPQKYKKYVELTSIFHDIGKANPNFQEYIFAKDKKQIRDKYKNHGYLSALILIISLIQNKKFFTDKYNTGLIALVTILIAKHHSNLPDIITSKDVLNKDELGRILTFFQNEQKTAKEFFQNTKDLLNHFKFPFQSDYENIPEQVFKNINRFLYKSIQDIPKNKILEYFIISQYIFSCVIEADKRDASDNDKFVLDQELEVFNHRYFSQRLKDFYDSFNNKNLSEKQSSLNTVRTEIKDTCVRNVKNFIQDGKRIFQIIAPTGSGKTLTFLSVASAIKSQLTDKDFKVIYTIPFLSITDQITKECGKIFNDNKDLIFRIDSAGKVINEVQEIQKEKTADRKDSQIDIDNQLILEDFAEHTFDHAFIVTTFVKLFETLTANRNRDLLRYNNFSNAIILIDEIQSLPPRSYTFLIALLEKYAELFNSYIIIGSATVPMFEIPNDEKALIKEVNGKKVNIKDIFIDYKPPTNLLNDFEKKYEDENFKRYKVIFDDKPKTLKELSEQVLSDSISTLCVLNTKKSSRELYQLLLKDKQSSVYLLNTLQTLNDRRAILSEVKSKLESQEVVYLVSTQLIEAGIDISFPKVYRDLAPFPSIIQTAGRCNRSWEINLGTTIVTHLVNEKGKSYYNFIYKDLMDFTQNILSKLVGKIPENKLLQYQQEFFENIKDKLEFGKYKLKYTDSINKRYYLQHTINNFEYDKLGQFTLIDNSEFDTISVYIVQTEKDKKDFENLYNLKDSDFSFALRIKIQKTLSYLSNRVVSIPLDLETNLGLFAELKRREIFGLSYIDVREDTGVTYDNKTGLTILSEDNTLII